MLFCVKQLLIEICGVERDFYDWAQRDDSKNCHYEEFDPFPLCGDTKQIQLSSVFPVSNRLPKIILCLVKIAVIKYLTLLVVIFFLFLYFVWRERHLVTLR